MVNIFQVKADSHLEEILNNNSHNIVVIMFSQQGCPGCTMVKPKFINLAKTIADCFFVYIDYGDFSRTSDKYTSSITEVPVFHFYYNREKVADVSGPYDTKVVEVITNIKQCIANKKIEAEKQMENHRKKLQQIKEQQLKEQQLKEQQLKEQQLKEQQLKEQQQNQQQTCKDGVCIPKNNYQNTHFQQKAILLKKLFELTKKGIMLTEDYNMNSDYDTMLWEYNLHTNLQSFTVKSAYQPTNQSDQSDQPDQPEQPDQPKQFIQTEQVVNQPITEQVVEKQPIADPIRIVEEPTVTDNGTADSSTSVPASSELQELAKKQDQYRKLVEVNKLTSLLKMQQLYKAKQIKQLEKFKKDKEREERRNRTHTIRVEYRE